MDLTHQQTALSGTDIDIGAALEFAKSDPDWVKKCGMHGLVMLIPVAGFLSLFGWSRKVYERARADERSLPELDIGTEVSHGIAPIVAMLNLALVTFPLIFLMWGALMVVSVGGGLVGSAGDTAAGIASIVMLVLMLGLQVFFMVCMFAVGLLTPELQRRGYNGEMGPLFSPAASIAAIKGNPKAYLMTYIGLFVASFIGSVGMFACYVGALITLPFGYAMSAHILAQWDAIVQRQAELT